MTTSRFRPARFVIAAAIATVALIGPVARAVPPCMTPILMVSEYSPGDSNTVSWFGDQSGGFEVQTAPDATFSSPRTIEKSPSSDSAEFTGLSEAQHFYRVRAKAKGGASGCATSAWSSTESTIQDATAPQVQITNRPEPISGLVTPPVPTYVMRSEIVITGTAADLPGGSAPSGVGAMSVALALENTTPGLGGTQPPLQMASVNQDGSWQVRYCSNTVACPGGKPASGTYTVNATGLDWFGNASDQPATLGIIIVL